MTRPGHIKRTLQAINQLAEDKAEEIFKFAEFIMKQHEEHQLTQGVHKIAAYSTAPEFLNHEEDLYTESDLKKALS